MHNIKKTSLSFFSIVSVFMTYFGLMNLPLGFVSDDADIQPPYITFTLIFCIGELLYYLILRTTKLHFIELNLALLFKIFFISICIIFGVTGNLGHSDSNIFPFYSFPTDIKYFISSREENYLYDGYSFYIIPCLVLFTYIIIWIRDSIKQYVHTLNNIIYMFFVGFLLLALNALTCWSLYIKDDRLVFANPFIVFFIHLFIYWAFIFCNNILNKNKAVLILYNFIGFYTVLLNLIYFRGYIMNYNHGILCALNNNAVTLYPSFWFSLLNYIFALMWMFYFGRSLFLEMGMTYHSKLLLGDYEQKE